MNKINHNVYLLFIVGFLGACATNGYQKDDVEIPRSHSGNAIFERDAEQYEADPELLNSEIYSEEKILNPAVQSLIIQSQNQRESNQYALASASLERALRIAPYTPQLHLHLGRLRLEEGNANAALQLARKGQSLLRGSESEALSSAFWNLLGDCYSYLGEADKAAQAYAKPYS